MVKKILIILISLVITSCASVQKSEEEIAFQRYWPDLPDTPRYEFMMSIYSSDDFVKKSETQKFRESVVGKSKPDYIFKRPIDLAVRNGMMYLLDTDRPVVRAFDFSRRRFFSFGYRFEGKLSRPVSVAIDSKGNVYVSDRGRSSVLVYDNFGLFKSVMNLDGVTTQAAGIAIDDEAGFLYVVDRGGIDSDVHQLLKYTLDGELVERLGKRGDKPMEFNLPVDVAVGPDGSVYVLDVGNFRVQKLSRDGRFIQQWGSAGDQLWQFGMPRSIAVDEESNVYVSDAQFGNVQIFNSEGKLLMAVGSLAQDDRPGAYSLITGIALDGRDHLFILDQFLKKMEIYKKLTPDERSKIVQTAVKVAN